MVNNKTLSSPKNFLKQLGKNSPDLKKMTESVQEQIRASKIADDFNRNPFRRDAHENLVYAINESGGTDDTQNILEVFDNIEDVEKYLSGKFFRVSKVETGEGIWPHYGDPKICLFPDSNIELNKELAKDVRNLAKSEGIDYTILPIVKLEKQKGGLVRRFKNKLPVSISRGQESLESICENIYSSQKEELTILYDIIQNYLGKEIEDLSGLVAVRGNKEINFLAEEFAKSRDKLDDGSYTAMVRKTLQNLKEGNSLNHIADQLLVATSYGFNLLNESQKSVVISNDQDLFPIFNMFYDQILPRYMAKTAIDAMKSRKPMLIKTPNYQGKMINAAREQIKWAKNHPMLGKSKEVGNMSLGVLYAPHEDKFLVHEVANPLRNYFENVQNYRHAKNELITEMVLTGKSANTIVEKLMQNA